MMREEMKKSDAVVLAIVLIFALEVRCEAPASPLKLVDTIRMPGIHGHFDHFGVDVKGHRLFVTPEDDKMVQVFDLRTDKLIHSISGIDHPHAVLYRADLDKIYVTDGDDGSLRIFNGKTYDLIKTVKLFKGADGIGYDPGTHYLYIADGGKDANLDYSLLSIVDTTAGEHVGDIHVEGPKLEAMALEKSSPKLFVDNRDLNRVEVIDRVKRTVLTSWPITRCTLPLAMSLDEAHHRLFVGCRSGDLVVFDTASGQEIRSLPVTQNVDDVVYDPAAKRIYASADGAADVYEEVDADHYRSIGKISTGPRAVTSLLVPELKRYFVAAAPHGTPDPDILVYAVE
jgi:DNA-binding beta-propeller fold protein YncE